MSDTRFIYNDPDTGKMCIVVPAPGVDLAKVKAKIRTDVTHEEVKVADLPSDRTFRNAWQHDTTESADKVAVDITTAKEITHTRRRAKRSEEFAEYDAKVTIPGESEAAEAARAEIRERYSAMQEAIESCTDADALKELIDTEGI